MGDQLWFVDEDGNRGTVSVSRARVTALEAVRGEWDVTVDAAVDALAAALPTTPWEPSDEMIGAYKSTSTMTDDEAIAFLLRRFHEAGMFAAWDRMQETDR